MSKGEPQDGNMAELHVNLSRDSYFSQVFSGSSVCSDDCTDAPSSSHISVRNIILPVI